MALYISPRFFSFIALLSLRDLLSTVRSGAFWVVAFVFCEPAINYAPRGQVALYHPPRVRRE
jgi:hypothetical protein